MLPAVIAASLRPLPRLVGAFYVTAPLFGVPGLGAIARWCGFSVFRSMAHLKDAMVPPMMVKVEAAGAFRSVVGLVIPAGCSFHLDGTDIYMTLATLFLAQAVGADLSSGRQGLAAIPDKPVSAMPLILPAGISRVRGASATKPPKQHLRWHVP